MSAFKYDGSKALAAVLYISQQLPGIKFHQCFKIIYFADLAHLAKYGRAIVGDRYIAMKDGPVPSSIYDLLKDIRDKRRSFFKKRNDGDALDVSADSVITPKALANLDHFSKTDLECLDSAISETKTMSYEARKVKSHDLAWTRAWNKKRNSTIDKNDIIEVSGASDDMKEYILQRETYTLA